MKNIFILASVLLFFTDSYSQELFQKVTDLYCDCIDIEMINTNDIKCLNEIEKCFAKVKSKNKNDLKKLFPSEEEAVSGIKKILRNRRPISGIYALINHYYKDKTLEEQEEIWFKYLEYLTPYDYLHTFMYSETIEPGHKGIVFNKYKGIIPNNILGSGYWLFHTNEELIKYDVRDKIGRENVDALLYEGKLVSIECEYRYYPNPDKIDSLHIEFGKYYYEKLIVPEIRSEIRKQIGKYHAENFLYISNDSLENAIYTKIKESPYLKSYIIFNSLRITALEHKITKESIEHDKLYSEIWSQLRSKDINLNKKGIDTLIKQNTKEAYLEIFNYWSRVSNYEIKKYILEKLMERNK